MKIAIIYYSFSGNTEYTVKEIKKKIDCDIFKIKLINEYPKRGIKKFFYCGKCACLEELVDYKCDCNLQKYDYIILANPIWASNITPPLRSFIENNKDCLKNKKLYILLSYSGGGAKRVIKKLKECLKVDSFQHILVLKDYNQSKINDFCNKIKKV